MYLNFFLLLFGVGFGLLGPSVALPVVSVGRTDQYKSVDLSGAPIGFLHLRYATENLSVSSVMGGSSSMYPLAAAIPVPDFQDWLLNDWTDDKENQLVAFLNSTAVTLLSSAQIQVIVSSLNWTTVVTAPLLEFRKKIFDKLDVTQIGDVDVNFSTLREDLDAPWASMLKMWRHHLGKDLNHDTLQSYGTNVDFSILAYPALQILRAVKAGNLVIDEESLKRIASKRISFGQAAVLMDAFWNPHKSLVKQTAGPIPYIPSEYFFAMPFTAILRLNDNAEDIEETLKALTGSFDRMFLSQRLAVLWKMCKVFPHKTVVDIRNSFSQWPGDHISSQLNSAQVLLPLSSLRLLKRSRRLNRIQETFDRSNPLIQLAIKALDGLVCEEIKNVQLRDIVSLIAVYNNISASFHEPEEIGYMPLSTAKCFRQTLEEYVKSKGHTGIDSGLTEKEILDIGGSVLCTILPPEITNDLATDLQKAFVHAIGNVPLAQLMPLSSSHDLTKFANLIIKKSDEKFDFDVLSNLGSLAFVVGDQLLGKVKPADVKLFIQSLMYDNVKRCVCIPHESRIAWKQLLTSAFGSPDTWTHADILDLGDLLFQFDSEQLNGIIMEVLRKSAPFFMRTTRIRWNYMPFPGQVTRTPFVQACQAWLEGDESGNHLSVSYAHLMRLILSASQMSVNFAMSDDIDLSLSDTTSPLDEVDNEQPRETEAATLSPPARPTEVLNTSLANDLLAATIDIVKRKNLPWSPETKAEFSVIVKMLKDRTKEVIVHALGWKEEDLPESDDELRKVIEQLILNKKIPANILANMFHGVDQVKLDYVRQIWQLFHLRPEDYGNLADALCAVVPCSPGSIQRQKRSTLKSDQITCNGLIAAQESAVSVRLQDLENWHPYALHNCWEVFGQIEWPDEVAAEIWESLFKYLVPDGTVLSGPEMFMLNKLLVRVAKADLDVLRFHDHSLEGISILGTSEKLDDDVAKKVAMHINAAYNLTQKNPEDFTDLDILRVASMSQLVCSLPVDVVKKILISPAGQRMGLAGILAYLDECKDIQILMVIAEEVDKMLNGRWLSSDVSGMGIIVAGLSPEKLSKFSLESLSSLPPQAVNMFTMEQLSKLTLEQISAIPPTSLAAMNKIMLLNNSVADVTLSDDQIAAIAHQDLPNLNLAKLMHKYSERLPDERRQSTKLTELWDGTPIDRSDTLQDEVLDVVHESNILGETGDGLENITGEADISGSTVIGACILLVFYAYLLFCCLS